VPEPGNATQPADASAEDAIEREFVIRLQSSGDDDEQRALLRAQVLEWAAAPRSEDGRTIVNVTGTGANVHVLHGDADGALIERRHYETESDLTVRTESVVVLEETPGAGQDEQQTIQTELQKLYSQSDLLTEALRNYKPAHSKHALIEAKLRETRGEVAALESFLEGLAAGGASVAPAQPRRAVQPAAPVAPTPTSSLSPRVVTRWAAVDVKESDVIDLDGVVLDITPELFVKLHIEEVPVPAVSPTPSRDELLREVHALTKAMLGELRELRSAVEDLRRNVNADGRRAGGTRSSSGTR